MKANKKIGLLYIAPAMFILFFFLIIPLFYTVYCSLFQLDYLVKGEFVGLDNYIKVLANKEVLQSFVSTVWMSLAATAMSMLLGLVLALWIDRKTGLFAYLIEMFGLIPWLISMVVAGLLWRWLFDGDLGLFNYVLNLLGFESIYVIQNRTSAIIALIFVMGWRTIGYAMILILAGLKGIDENLIEAAKVDGASAWRTLFAVKLPLIKTPMLLSTIVLTVSNFTNNTVPKVLTSGGPGSATSVITLQQYNMSFRYYQFGESSALSVLIMLVTVAIIICYIKIADYKI